MNKSGTVADLGHPVIDAVAQQGGVFLHLKPYGMNKTNLDESPCIFWTCKFIALRLRLAITFTDIRRKI